jgi:hypothetical protein
MILEERPPDEDHDYNPGRSFYCRMKAAMFVENLIKLSKDAS